MSMAPFPSLAHLRFAYGRQSFGQAIPAGGTLEFVVLRPPQGIDYLIERIVHRGIGLTDIRWFVDQATDLNEVENTTVTVNVADESSPIWVPEGTDLIARFVGPAGNIVTGTVQYRMLER